MDYLNIRIDGSTFGDEVASTPTIEERAMAMGPVPGMPAVDPSVLAAKVEARRTAAVEQYEKAVFGTLVAMSHSLTGQAVIEEIRRSRQDIVIEAYLGDDGDFDNAKARPAEVSDATAKARWPRDKDGERIEGKKRGSGLGSASTIEFLPRELVGRVKGRDAVATKAEEFDPMSLDYDDETLIHELVHSMRHVTGRSNRKRVPRQPKYEGLEEMIAITVANVYRSEARRHGVRSANHLAMEKYYVSGKDFLTLHFNRLHLWAFCRQHPELAKDLGKVDAYFNPFQYLRAAQ